MENRSIDMHEEWIELKQYGIPRGEFFATEFAQDGEGVRIVLDDGHTFVKVLFNEMPLLVREAEEGLRMRTWGEVQLKHPSENIFRYSFFFEVKNSKLTQWFIEEGCSFYKECEIRHYCIVTSEELIDVLSTFEPIVEVFNLLDKN